MKTETTILIASFITSIILGIIIIPILKKLKVGQIERDDGPQSHLKKQGTPTMGGIIIIITMILVVTGTYIFLTMQGESQQFIAEHLPPDIPQMLVLIAFSICILILSIIGKIKMHQLFLVMGLTLMATSSNRHLSLYTIFIFPIMSILVNNIFKCVKINIDKYTLKYVLSKLGITVIIIILGIITGISIYFNKDKVFIEHDTYPVDATKYIKENLDYQNIRLLNEYNYGSYLLFNEILVFIDSRADLYTIEFNKTDDILTTYMNNNYFEIINKYDITHVIAKKDENLYKYTQNNGIFNKLYEDDYFAIFEVI